MLAWPIIAITAAYIAVLFWIAHRADKVGHVASRARSTWIFGLSLAVYCTSWTYYGAVGTATTAGWHYLPIYLGPALLFAFGRPMLKRLVEAGKKHHIASISDFLGSRYGKSQRLGALVTVIAAVGALPYIALQLKSIAMTYTVLTGRENSAAMQNDLVLIIAVSLAVFAIIFGTRHADVTQPNRGMVLAIVVEAAFKLAALLAIGVLAFLLVSNSSSELVGSAAHSQFAANQLDARFVSLTLLSMGAVLCLPRQFHMLVVEATDPDALKGARWVFVGYLALTALVVLPITQAGLAILPAGTDPDLFVLLLPLASGHEGLAVITYLGGFAAASGMVIVSAVALSIMISNDLALPALLARQGQRESNLAAAQRTIRRASILLILAMAYGFQRLVTEQQTLAALGILSFAAAVQFLPALIGGLYWPRGNKRGVFTGLLLGFAAWLFTLVVPALSPVFSWAADIQGAGAFGQTWLRPDALFGTALGEPLTHGLTWSLGLNTLAFMGVSFFTRPDGVDLIQASAFVGSGKGPSEFTLNTSARVKDLRALLVRAMGEKRAHEAFEAYDLLSGGQLLDRDILSADLIEFGEGQLTRVLGAASSRLLLQSVLTGASLRPQDVVTLLDETSQTLEFNRELLQATLENIVHGVCVVDKDMRIAAWNTPYVDMFDYPADLVKIGRPIANIIRYNAEQGTWPGEDADTIVERRVGYMRAGNPHDFSRTHFDGRFIDIQGRPMPGGGYVTTYMDVTARVQAEQALKETNETLEQRVKERTRALEALNEKLEAATASKTRFLAAASHDLLQPLNAARLFTSALSAEMPSSDAAKQALLEKVDQSITSADTLLKTLLNISKLDAGGIEPRPTRFAVGGLLQELYDEFSVIAAGKGLELRLAATTLATQSDRGLLRSVLQNFISNAVRYTQSGKILIGCRRAGKDIAIQVYDTGQGIPVHEQRKIFEEFHQVRQDGQGAREGLGLGLAIVQRIAGLLGHPVALTSVHGKGSVFEIRIPRTTQATESAKPTLKKSAGDLGPLTVLCVDNDHTILSASTALLERWGCHTRTVANIPELEAECSKAAPPDLILLDYQLNDDVTGFDYLGRLEEAWNGYSPPVIMMTAAQDDDMEREAARRGIRVLAKPIAPAQLRALMRQLCQPSRDNANTEQAQAS
ncbi:MAG: NahK/ErcS family hybrid sensor histidine kinase/response regulator [Pseudomonadota bacterium]